MKPLRGKGWVFPSARRPLTSSQIAEARGELGCLRVATKTYFWICLTVSALTLHILEVMRRGRPPQHWRLWAWCLIIQPLSLAHTNGCHLFPRLYLRGSPALSSITGSSGCLVSGKPLLMTLLGERAVASLGPPLLTPWSHHPLQRSRRPKEPARPSSEQTNLGWCLGNLWKRAWGPGRSQLGLSTSHLQVSPCLRCFISLFRAIHKLFVLFRDW